MYMQWVYFTLSSLNVEFMITSPYITWGKWYDHGQENELVNEKIAERVFSRFKMARFGASGRDHSPSGTEGGFSVAVKTGANTTEKVLDVYFSIPWARKGSVLTHKWRKSSGHFCYVGSSAGFLRLGNIDIYCGKLCY